MKSLVKFSNYKYIDSLLDGKIKASFSYEFNDPFDSRIYVSDETKELISSHLNKSFDEIDFYYHMIQSAQIACLIKCDPFDFNESVLMWAHYAESSKNLSVCFDYEKILLNQDKPYKEAWLDVNYHRPIKSSKQFLEDYVNASISGEAVDKMNILKEFFSTKHEKWSYEQEIRIIHFGFIEKQLTKHRREFDKFNPELIKILSTRFQSFKELIDGGYQDSLFLDLMEKPNKVIIGYNFDKKDLPDLTQKCLERRINLSRLALPIDFINFEYKEEFILEF